MALIGLETEDAVGLLGAKLALLNRLTPKVHCRARDRARVTTTKSPAAIGTAAAVATLAAVVVKCPEGRSVSQNMSTYARTLEIAGRKMAAIRPAALAVQCAV